MKEKKQTYRFLKSDLDHVESKDWEKAVCTAEDCGKDIVRIIGQTKKLKKQYC